MSGVSEIENEECWIGTFLAAKATPSIHCLMVDNDGIPFWRFPEKDTTNFIPAQLGLLKRDLLAGDMFVLNINYNILHDTI